MLKYCTSRKYTLPLCFLTKAQSSALAVKLRYDGNMIQSFMTKPTRFDGAYTM